MSSPLRVGLISDTHSLMRPEALDALQGSDYIIHAGDIGDPRILSALAEIAPVTAVRGNNDRETWASSIPETAVLRVGAISIYVIHILGELSIDPAVAGHHAVITGHSHKPVSQLRNGVLFVNPGSAGPRRFTLPVSVGRLVVSGAGVQSELVELQVAPPVRRTAKQARAKPHTG
jgi:putative phosphoesterase